MRKLVILLLIMSIAIFIAVGCETDPEVVNDVDVSDELVIGTLFPLSGPMATLGDESWRGAELARQKINEEGGILGNEVIFENADIPDTSAAMAEAERLILDEGLTVLVGSYASPLAMAASEVAERNGVVYFETGSVANPITERGFEWLFRACPKASELGVLTMEFVADVAPEVLGKELSEIKVSVAFEDGPYGSTVGEYAVERAEELGMEVVAVEPYDSEAADLSPMVERLRAADPDFLSHVAYLTDAILFHEQAVELDLYIPIYMGGGGGHTYRDYAETIGDDVIGTLDCAYPQYDINRDNAPGMEEFLERYEAEYGMSPRSGHSVMVYTSTLALFEAIELAGGSLDPEDVREGILALNIPKFSTPNGMGFDFNTPTNDNANSQLMILQWDKIDGEYVQIGIFPEELALRDAELPMVPWGESR